MKRMLVINSLAGGGAERIATRLANHWARSGSVRIVLLDGGHSRYALDDRVLVQRLFLGYLVPSPLRVAMIPLLGLELLLWRLILRPDACISFLVRANLVNIFSWFGLRGAIISERNNTQELYRTSRLSHVVMRGLVKFAYRRARFCICISHGIKSSLVRLGMAPERIEVIYNPIGRGVSAPRSPTETPTRLVTAGRLIEQKNHKMLLAAVGLLRDQGIDVSLEIYGDGPLLDELRQQVGDANLSDRVTLRGFSDSLHSALHSCDVFVFSSRYEGFGNVIVEAMLEGLPVISTDCAFGPREIIGPETLTFDEGGLVIPGTVDGHFEICSGGLLTRVDDPAGMAAAIRWMIEDPARYTQFSIASTERAKAFDMDIIAHRYDQAMRPEAYQP